MPEAHRRPVLEVHARRFFIVRIKQALLLPCAFSEVINILIGVLLYWFWIFRRYFMVVLDLF